MELIYYADLQTEHTPSPFVHEERSGKASNLPSKRRDFLTLHYLFSFLEQAE